MLKFRSWLVLGMIAYAVGIKIMPYLLSHLGMNIDPSRTTYPWNFSPLSAIFLFSGSILIDRRWACVVPLVALAASDALIGILMGDIAFAVYGNQPFVYSCFLLTALLGTGLRNRKTQVGAIAGTALLAEIVFFLVTNFGTWLGLDGLRMYPPTPAGLLACYVAALPYFGRSLLSTGMYTVLLFGSWAWLTARSPQRELSAAVSPE